MPKILNNVFDRIIEVGRKQLSEKEYNNISIRSITKEAHIATGTFYNYFESKDHLLSYLINDNWLEVLSNTEKQLEEVTSFHEGIDLIYNNVNSFTQSHRHIWRSMTSPLPMAKNHSLIIQQISNLIHILIDKFNISNLNEFEIIISEFLLTCVGQEYLSIKDFHKVINRLIK